jgi:hypothetical protein
MSELADHPILKKKEKHVDVHGHHAVLAPPGLVPQLLLLCLSLRFSIVKIHSDSNNCCLTARHRFRVNFPIL